MNALDCAGRLLDLSQPQVMGILNVTPDSFSDGGSFLSRDAAIERAARMVAEGAAVIDVGGESTRPGARSVSVAEELDRIVPVIEALSREIPVPISVDTSKPELMRAAVNVGAGLINDVRALRAEGALAEAARLGVPVCLMHMQGEPRSMQEAPVYGDVVGEVKAFLASRIEVCAGAGIAPGRILVDPGFGFGKRLEHNVALLQRLETLDDLGCPVLVGVSRKSMIGKLLGDADVAGRLYGSVAAAVVAVMKGAAVVRVHDVGPTIDAVRICRAVLIEARGDRGVGHL